MVSRKDMLLEDSKRPQEKKEVLEKELNDGGALYHLLDTRGWKLLYEEYILPNMKDDRFLSAPNEELVDTRAEIRVLKGLMKFIDTRLSKANEAALKIKT